ncbi:hypothetical protein BDN72DRAFT_762426 [Pluteus cervinus]|uniref:Uncharacterized protein n=1 Tax=Pluteus cervinus TaxID=181527 RepID=A0ACD3B5K4_9AGAR|nr:hypothetical protein BDN72DRAFT_762426 [Pluteus cervinus]
MKRIPYFRAQLTQFPWGRIEADGTCPHEIIRAKMGLLGVGPAFGYWSARSDVRPHDSAFPEPELSSLPTDLHLPTTKTYFHGQTLLAEEWPDHTTAWKLKDPGHIPLLDFSDVAESLCPSEVEEGEIFDWESWYKWRSIPVASPAAWLMSYPLSIYHLLVNVLKIVDPKRSSSYRQPLHVHYLGAESELNFIPIFSELALLLPHTDLTITIFGKAAYNLIQLAKQSYPNSIAAKNPVWEYTAPDSVGGSTININLYDKAENWTRQAIVDEDKFPDAMIGLNAGLLSDNNWGDPMMFSALLEIPFAITDYMEQILETTVTALPTLRTETARMIGEENAQYSKLMEPFETSIDPNPFHKPGQRCISVVRLPNIENGFCMKLVGLDPIVWERRDEAEAERWKEMLLRGEVGREGGEVMTEREIEKIKVKDRVLAIVLGLLTAVVAMIFAVQYRGS